MRRIDILRFRRRVRRFARRTTSVGYRSIAVPLLARTETEHALDLACRLAADRHARVLLIAPLLVDLELPLNAHFDRELSELHKRLDSAAAIAESYGVTNRRLLLRTRVGALGRDLADEADGRRCELIVVGAPVESKRGFRHAFPPEIMAILYDAPCRVMIATGPKAGHLRTGAVRQGKS